MTKTSKVNEVYVVMARDNEYGTYRVAMVATTRKQARDYCFEIESTGRETADYQAREINFKY